MENFTTDYVKNAFEYLKSIGRVHTQKEFATLIETNTTQLSKVMNGVESNLSRSMILKLQQVMEECQKESAANGDTLPVIPTEAMAGTLGEFTDSVREYQCERMISPIKGADYAMKVCGDSMSPEYPSGCQILIKKINEKAFIEWGKVYVLDTDNGAVIKQIRRTDKEGIVECVSLNPAFQPFTINTSFIHGWYRVLMVLALK